MAESKKQSNKLTKIVVYFYVVLILLLLLTVSTYTWFSLSKTPRVSSLSMYVTTATGMEIALTPDSEEWGQQLSYTDMVSETSPLRPVSWSEKDKMFYAAVYGIDGRLTGKWQPLSDERNANRNDYNGYYCIGTFYARTEERVKVSLTPAIEIDEGKNGSGTYLIGFPTWSTEDILHHNAGQGAENAVRVGIKITHLGDDNLPTDEEALFYIYEPNCDKHLDGSVGYVNTPSLDGTETLVPPDRIITQTASEWTEAFPIEKNRVIHTFGEFTSSTELFTLDAYEKVKIQIYVWLEGQDVDCTNAIEDAQILASIQFLATTDQSSPIKPIE